MFDKKRTLFKKRPRGLFRNIWGDFPIIISGRFFAILFSLLVEVKLEQMPRSSTCSGLRLSLGYISFVNCLSLSC